MNSLFAFLNRMDATAWRTVLVTLGLFAGLGAILVVGKFALLDSTTGQGMIAQIEAFLLTLRNHPAGLPVLITLFCTACFIGAPQMLLIGLAVVTFGPVQGMLYAWIATLFSLSLTFWVGRLAGEDMLKRYGGRHLNRLSRFIGKNDFLASLIVRNVPLAPFIVVNMAFGVSAARFWRFLVGAAIGSLPKMAMVAFGGGAIEAILKGAPWEALAALGGAALIWIAIVLVARSRLRASEGKKLPEDV